MSTTVPRTVRVATFNIHHGADPAGVVDLERTARAIEELDADVVLLQEVDRNWQRSGGADQATTLAERLGRHHAFGAALELPAEQRGTGAREYGQLILSRHPFSAVGRMPLPSQGRSEPRMLLRADIEINGTVTTFAVAHLDDADAGARLRQGEAVLRALTGVESVVFGGDLNEDAEGSAHRLLTSVWTDAWRAGGDGPGTTFLGDDADPEPARLDHLFCSTALRCTSARVAVSATGVSDHLPLVADFTR
ncbi:endonuclease/exonuclease/phosphatase family protein [Microbacterium sp. NPDC057659]|uniref:endonuclease/exonuclease/phosphatase family protein n=1 Tax=Microbacterium sp. NPDC057659 TaxID=3346198 RepID=UPI00366E2889